MTLVLNNIEYDIKRFQFMANQESSDGIVKMLSCVCDIGIDISIFMLEETLNINYLAINTNEHDYVFEGYIFDSLDYFGDSNDRSKEIVINFIKK